MALRQRAGRTEQRLRLVRILLRPWAGESNGRCAGAKRKVSALRILSLSTAHAEIALVTGATSFPWARSDYARAQGSDLRLHQLLDVPRALWRTGRWLRPGGYSRGDARRDHRKRGTDTSATGD